ARCDHAGLRYESDESGRTIAVLLPHLSPMRDLSKAAIVAGKRLELEGQSPEAAAMYLDVLGAAAHVGQGVTLVESLVAMTTRSLGDAALLDAYAGPGGDQLDFAAIARQLDTPEWSLRPLGDVLQAERAAVLDTAQRLFRADASGVCVPDPKAARELLELIAGLGQDESDQSRGTALRHLNFEATVQETNVYFDALTDAVMMPYPDGRAMLEEVERHVNNEDANALLRLMSPSLKRSLSIWARSEAQHAGLRLLTHLRAYQHEHGVYPESLDALDRADLTTDPLSNKPFAYRRVGDDIRLYSLGADGIDGGGVHDDSGERRDYLIWPRPRE
ncbi:MAG: hypothetical protein JXO22_09750, partial [Phycisphaerae bacterium]|nr:hypothetical protein [Phycisphaerae bacterium]